MLEYGDGLWPSIGIITVRLGALPFVFVSVSCLLVFCDFYNRSRLLLLLSTSAVRLHA